MEEDTNNRPSEGCRQVQPTGAASACTKPAANVALQDDELPSYNAAVYGFDLSDSDGLPAGPDETDYRIPTPYTTPGSIQGEPPAYDAAMMQQMIVYGVPETCIQATNDGIPKTQNTSGTLNCNRQNQEIRQPHPLRVYRTSVEAQVEFKKDPVQARCKSCFAYEYTRVHESVSSGGWVWCILCFSVGIWPFSFMVKCMDGFRTWNHYCPRCQKQLSTYSPSFTAGARLLLSLLAMFTIFVVGFIVYSKMAMREYRRNYFYNY